MNHFTFSVCLFSLVLSTAVLAQPARRADRPARISPEMQEQLRALHEQASAMRAGGGMSPEERKALVEQAKGILESAPEEVKAAVREKVDRIKSRIAARVPEEIKQAAAAVRADLQAIQAGGYVSRAQIDELRQAVRAALSDREFTDTEKQQLTAQAKALAELVPSEMRDQLRSDAEALADLVRSR